MSKDLKIKGALSKDFQQIYIDDEPTGLFINNEGKIKIKDLVVSDKSALSNENLEIKRGSDYFTSSSAEPTTAITNSGDMVLDVNGDFKSFPPIKLVMFFKKEKTSSGMSRGPKKVA